MVEYATAGGDDEVLEIQQAHYILATSSRADDRTRVLKEGETFAVFDRFGDIQPVGLGEQGLYVNGTRFLSRLELRVGGRRPLLLSSNVREDNDVLTVDLTNPDLIARGTLALPRSELHIQRSKLLWDGCCHERLIISNHSLQPVESELVVSFDADFADIFEVRGTRRARRGFRYPGQAHAPSGTPGQPDAGVVDLAYEGLDGRLRRTRLVFEPRPAELGPNLVRFPLVLGSRARTAIEIRVETAPGVPPAARRASSFAEAEAGVRGRIERLQSGSCAIRSSNASLNRWLMRSRADLHMMITDTPFGPFPYAGVPWFSAPFGRDSLITALSCLWLEPALACGVLRFLAAHQATETNPEQDAQPGKILHEMRGGEMAALGEVPFGRYYGSVDATPLFLVLAGATYQRTGDRALIDELWPNLVAALAWIDRHGDADGDGFVEYARGSASGLVQQGWKDSSDSIFHADGRLARPPIALCEVQAYVHLARVAMTELAELRGDLALADRQRAQALALRDAFAARFWCQDIGTFALALDADKQPCRVRSSNAGQVLLSGLPRPAQARAVAAQLMSPPAFSGWGIRTLSEGEPRYNPMSYHNGSVWPHDNALIAAGLSRHGLRREVLALFSAMLKASTFVDLNRLPELFCGFPSRAGEGPTLYPVACAPQAWAAATPYLLLSACLGMTVSGRDGTVSFVRPSLPASVSELRIEGLVVAPGKSADLLLQRHEHDVGITVLRREGPVRVLVER
jgi:glycogen debranching enzyme